MTQKLFWTSILLNAVGITAFSIFYFGNSFILDWGPPARFFEYEKSYVEASGMLVAENYKPGYPYQLYLVKCERSDKSGQCVAVVTTIDKGYLLTPSFEEFQVSEWNDSKVVGLQDFGCRKQYWIFDIPSQTVRMESVYKDPISQRGDCSLVETDTRKSRLADWSEAIKQAEIK